MGELLAINGRVSRRCDTSRGSVNRKGVTRHYLRSSWTATAPNNSFSFPHHYRYARRPLDPLTLHNFRLSTQMAPKPASTAGKAPASTASKAPAKTTEGTKGAKKTAKPAASSSDDKKKRRKTRKETYSSYIYKGESSGWPKGTLELGSHAAISPQAGPPRHWYLQQGDGHSQLLRQRYLRADRH